MPPIISIIIPVYNCEYTLADSLESTLSQSLSDIEIICVNDASRDASFEILKYYRRQDARIRIINQEHLGAAVARNRGITTASGRFLFFLDADDFFPDRDVLLDLYNAATESRSKIAGGSFCTFSQRRNRTVKTFQEPFDGYVFPGDGLVFYEDYQFDLGFQRF
ncbi:MAG: glycosyltransferase, partial [Clostridiales Family XIII bacterium]|nr:glycosyltransferase [Clostridiales Family XIII bacterium]